MTTILNDRTEDSKSLGERLKKLAANLSDVLMIETGVNSVDIDGQGCPLESLMLVVTVPHDLAALLTV